MFQVVFTVTIDGDPNEDRDMLDSIVDEINSHGKVVGTEVDFS